MTTAPRHHLIRTLNDLRQQRDDDDNSAATSLAMAETLLALSELSPTVDEQKRFVFDAITLLEIKLLDDVTPLHLMITRFLAQLYIELSLLEDEPRLLNVVQRLLKPMASQQDPAILLQLIRLESLRHNPALTQFYIKKLMALSQFNPKELLAIQELQNFSEFEWWQSLHHQLTIH